VHGKPALARSRANLHLSFNVSHCEDVALYAFAYGREVGVDVEAIRLIRDADAIATRFFSSRENDTYRALAPCDKPIGFFNCWTRKEAFIKALGDGLYHPSLAPGEPAKLIRVGSITGENCGWILHSFTPLRGFVGAIAVQSFPRSMWPRE
jgi:4'-phosphopantetheinyl transferase